MRLSQTLAAAALLPLATYAWPQDSRLQIRQDDFSLPVVDLPTVGPTDSPSPTGDDNPTSDQQSTTTQEETSPTSEPPTSTPTTTEQPPTTTEQPPPTTTQDLPTTTNLPPETTTTLPATPSIIEETVTSIISGTPTQFTTTRSSTPTPTPTPTADGSLAGNGDSSGSSEGGMSESTRNTIIGVCVGVGGAIILGGLMVVAWRLWGRKKMSPEEEDVLMGSAYGGNLGAAGGGSRTEKSGSVDSPFRTTLDQYHNPAGRPNQASNF